jgi:hypothetical protein
MARIDCVPSVTNPFTETRSFKWNVSGYVRDNNGFPPTLSCSYYVGEGPLYWFRIEWHFRSCPPNPCKETTPMISYIMPNCPYEIIENCIVMQPSVCPKDPCCCAPCCQKVEIWHMLATSVTHLCERINQECCNPKPSPSYFITRVQQYSRPALCCDVQALGASDGYTDVDFIKCECGNLIDPCKAVVIYPCHVNRCGINGPAFGDGPVPPISNIKFAPDLLDFQPLPLAMAAEVSPTKPLEFKEMSPSVVKKFGSPISEMIRCEHNLGQASILRDYLKRNHISFDSMNLFYNKTQNIWQGSKDFRDWWVSMEWSPLEKRGYKLNITVVQRNGSTKRTKADFIVKSDNIISDRNNLDVKLDFDPFSGVVSAKNGTLQSKLIKDDIGLFNKCKNLVFNLKG